MIALLLGYKSTTTTRRYVEADSSVKEKAFARLVDLLMRFSQVL
ncbi:hypothetical protein [Paralcaligenes ureilyticus]|nr:hypothetical protein [Paralcaligenes ureilyticus]